MSDTVNFAELDGQHVELLPARTVMSMFARDGGGLGGLLDGIFPKDGPLGGLFGAPADNNSNSTGGAAGAGKN